MGPCVQKMFQAFLIILTYGTPHLKMSYISNISHPNSHRKFEKLLLRPAMTSLDTVLAKLLRQFPLFLHYIIFFLDSERALGLIPTLDPIKVIGYLYFLSFIASINPIHSFGGTLIPQSSLYFRSLHYDPSIS